LFSTGGRPRLAGRSRNGQQRPGWQRAQLWWRAPHIREHGLKYSGQAEPDRRTIPRRVRPRWAPAPTEPVEQFRSSGTAPTPSGRHFDESQNLGYLVDLGANLIIVQTGDIGGSGQRDGEIMDGAPSAPESRHWLHGCCSDKGVQGIQRQKNSVGVTSSCGPDSCDRTAPLPLLGR